MARFTLIFYAILIPNLRIICYDDKGDVLPCFPNEITIIQGSVVGAAPLPYNIAIGTWDEDKQRSVITMVTGLEKTNLFQLQVLLKKT